LIAETCLDTGTRISEATGLMVKDVDLDQGIIRIEQRNWRGDIDEPKTDDSKRILTLGPLTARFRAWIATLERRGPNAWVFPQGDDLAQPLWDTGVRKALKLAAAAEGLDFEGFGPHSLRRANITWRQEVGGTSIETSKIAGHSSTETTMGYTVVGLERQRDLTARVHARRTKGQKRAKVVEIKRQESAA
jgi:integrase